MNITTKAISCTFARDLPLSVQIQQGIADWEASDDDGRIAYGHSEAEAINNLKSCAGFYVSAEYKKAMGI